MTDTNTDQLLALMPFAVQLGIELDAAAPEEVSGRLAWAPERCTVAGVMHGGALMAFADTLGGVCAYLNLPAGAQTTTINSSTSFMRAVREGEVTAVARPLHAGAPDSRVAAFRSWCWPPCRSATHPRRTPRRGIGAPAGRN